MEIPRAPGQRAYPESERRRGNQQFEGGHEVTCRRPSHPRQIYGHRRRSTLTRAPYERTRKSNVGVGSGKDGSSLGACHKIVRRRFRGRSASGPSPSASAGTEASRVPRSTGTSAGAGDGYRCRTRSSGAAGDVEGADGDGEYPGGGQGTRNRQAKALGVLTVLPGYRVIAQ